MTEDESNARPATESQLKYVKALFRKVKFYYQCQDDAALAIEVKARTGFDLTKLTHGDVQAIVAELVPVAEQKRRSVFRQWGRGRY